MSGGACCFVKNLMGQLRTFGGFVGDAYMRPVRFTRYIHYNYGRGRGVPRPYQRQGGVKTPPYFMIHHPFSAASAADFHRTSTTATSFTLVPVGPVNSNPPAACSAV